jgi:cell division septation protein DedD
VTPADQPAPDQAATDAGGAPAQASAAGAQANGNSGNQAQVHPALAPGAVPQAYSAGAPQPVHPALASQPLVVQVAAISNPDDAEVLVDALRKRDYPVTARRDPADNFIHVRIGPFATRAIAEQWRMKLLNDGYNAVVQQ